MKPNHLNVTMSCLVETRLADISRQFEDLSVTNSSMERLSPTAVLPPSAHSRKSSTGDSAFYDYDPAEDSHETPFKHQLCQRTEPVDSSSPSAMMEKFAMLEERLREMEARLKQESEERSKLEKKVNKLEEENESLKSSRLQAVSQLQTFSEKFFAMKEPLAPKFDPSSPVFTSPMNSPRGSNMELRRIGSSSSMASRMSRNSMKSRPTSGISL